MSINVKKHGSERSATAASVPLAIGGGVRGAHNMSTHHRKPSIVALQASTSSHLQASKKSKTHAQKATKHTHSKRAKRDNPLAGNGDNHFLMRSRSDNSPTGGSHFLVRLHKQAIRRQKSRTRRQNMCDGNKYGWIISIRAQCKENYGEESTWDRQRDEGACQEAWNECNSGFADICCTQPEGPRNMQSYCQNQNARGGERDRACDVQGQMSGVQGNMRGIRDVVSLMNTNPPPQAPPTTFQVLEGNCQLHNGGRCVASTNWPEDYPEEDSCEIKAPTQGVVYPRVKIVAEDWHTESCCDKLHFGNDDYFSGGPEEAIDAEVFEPTTLTWTSDFSSNKAGWKICAQDIPPAVPPPPGAPAPPWAPGSPPGGPPGILAPPAPAPASHGPRKPTLLETQCQKLTDLVKAAAREVDNVQRWAEHDGIVPPSGAVQPHEGRGASLLQIVTKFATAASGGGTSEAKDPDLTFAMRKVLKIGVQLRALRDSKFCSGTAPDDDDDDDDDDSLDDGYDDDDLIPAPAPGPSPAPESDTEVNGTAVQGLLEWEEEMEAETAGFESGVHPHGKKWWRYRYEYTLVESLVLAFVVMTLYGAMCLLHGVSFFHKFKFYKIGLTSRLYRYAWGYTVFHAAALMIMSTITYMLYMPWGETNIFDVGAKAFHEAVDGRANIPFLGYSWLIMFLDVQFQLFVCFLIYALFVVFVIFNFQKALEDWKQLSDRGVSAGLSPANVKLYNDLSDILQLRVQKTRSLQRLFNQMKLRMPNVAGPEAFEQDWYDFKLHLYLTDALGRALEHLVEVSLKTNVILACSALLVALLAHHYQVAFMYFLPIFVAFGFLFFAAAFLVGYQLMSHAKDHDNDQPLHWLTMRSYCRSIQIVLYCVFFSFSRLLLSNDIFTDYPNVYLAAALGLLLILVICWYACGHLMKYTICAMDLPPQIDEDRFRKNLQQVGYWYSTSTCHECGVRQFAHLASYNKDWASSGDAQEKGDAAETARSQHRWSWR